MWAIASVYDVQNSVTSVGIHYTRKDHVLDGIENDRSVRLRGRLAVKASSWKIIITVNSQILGGLKT